MLTTPDAAMGGVFLNTDPRRRAIYDEVRRWAAQTGMAAYLVGGPVRDYLLGVPVNDLDIAVVGDAPALAAGLADVIGGRLTVHRRFGTATVSARDLTIDLVTARRETYRHPGALPDVQPSAIADDLARRDFTVNAMAIPIANDAAELVDPHRGRADLDAGIIRILHPRSFRDDPTRILRAVRYARRLNFRIDDATLSELQTALSGNALSTLSGDRVRHELARILQEPSPPAALRYADALGVLAAIHPSLSASHLRRRPDAPAAPLTWLAALVWPLSSAAGAALRARLNAPADWARATTDTAALVERLPQLAAPDLMPSEVCARLDGLSPDALRAAVILASPVVAERVRRYLSEWWSLAPRLSGSDLLELGVPAGPAVGAALRALRQARLDGETHSRQDETQLARQWASPAA